MHVSLLPGRSLRSPRRSLDRTVVSYATGSPGRLPRARTSFSELPVEIISMIFEYATRTTNPQEFPEVVLSHVCCRWRSIALNTSILWTFIAVDFSQAQFISPANFIDSEIRPLAYLKRSKLRCVDILLNIHGHPIIEGWYDVFDALLAHCERWRTLTVQSTSELESLLVSRMLHGFTMPNLESLNVQTSIPSGLDTSIGLLPVVFQNGTPKLTYVSLDLTSARYYLPPLQDVTTLDLRSHWGQAPCFTFVTFCDVLRLPSLTALSLERDVCDIPEDPTILMDLVLENLRHLCLDESTIITNLLMYFNAPKLETLVVTNVDLGDSDDDGEPTYPKDPATCFPSLKRLTLSAADPSSPCSAIPLARVTRNIEHLVVSDPETCFIYDVEWTDENAGFWPNLSCMTVCSMSMPGYFFTEPSYLLKGAKIREHKMTYQFLPQVIKEMEVNMPGDFAKLIVTCNVEEITNPSSYTDAEWPPS